MNEDEELEAINLVRKGHKTRDDDNFGHKMTSMEPDDHYIYILRDLDTASWVKGSPPDIFSGHDTCLFNFHVLMIIPDICHFFYTGKIVGG